MALAGIVIRRCRAVCIDIIDLSGADVCHGQCLLHSEIRPIALGG